jgi:hypothetical protein
MDILAITVVVVAVVVRVLDTVAVLVLEALPDPAVSTLMMLLR